MDKQRSEEVASKITELIRSVVNGAHDRYVKDIELELAELLCDAKSDSETE